MRFTVLLYADLKEGIQPRSSTLLENEQYP